MTGVCGAVHMPPIEGRLIQTWMYERTHLDDNHYSHPIDFVPLVDLNLKKVSPSAELWPCLSDLGAMSLFNAARLVPERNCTGKLPLNIRAAGSAVSLTPQPLQLEQASGHPLCA